MFELFRRLVRERLCMNDPYRFNVFSFQSGTYIHQLLQRQYPDAEIRVADSIYNAPTRKEVEAWLKSDPVNERQYHAAYHDCDDFARALRCAIFRIGHAMKTTLTVAYCEGYAMGSYHAFNLLIDDKGSIFIIEPQTDIVVPAVESTYLPDFIEM